jgi:hypothetical protein
MTSPIHLFSLIHVEEGESSAPNVKTSNHEQLLELYVRNAITLARSLARAGIRFTVACAEPELIDGIARRYGGADLAIQRIHLGLDIPSGIPFYAAHYKIDLFRQLGTVADSEYLGIVDCDVIALGDQPPALARLVESGTPLVYDITDQVVPAYGRDVVVGDLEKLTGGTHATRWFGGEFLAGPAAFFRALCDEIERSWPVYVDMWRGLHHHGDEILVSAAVERLRSCGLYVEDAGALGIVRRHWSIPTTHPQPPFDSGRPVFLLHLPADKAFLASLSNDTEMRSERFLTSYQRRLRRRALPNVARGIARRLQARLPTP